MSVDGNNPEYGVQVPVLVHPVADGHLFNLIGALWHLMDVRSCLIDEIVHLERSKDVIGPELADLSEHPIRDTEAMLGCTDELSKHLVTILTAFLDRDRVESGEFFTWYRTVVDLLEAHNASQ